MSPRPRSDGTDTPDVLMRQPEPWPETGGLFITLDGPSGVGKTTMGARLGTFLGSRGLKVCATTEPSHSAIGELARYGTHEYHGIALSLLIAADRYHHVETVVRPALERGEAVVCDRYLPSSLAMDQLDGVPPDFLWNIHRHLPWPHLAIFLTGHWQLCATRAAGRGNHSRFHLADQAAKQREVELFNQVADQLAAAGYPVCRYDIGDQDPDTVHRALAEQVAARLGL
ncbi:dTMP kinase [Streptacidiphilus sp. EB103A]|uniref:dTMP kinase n=1 Tax=Streptacidiphilus sp. EB103A TaxID=3156275 RepID=UPI0035145105